MSSPLLLTALLVSTTLAAAAPADGPYEFLHAVPLGGAGGWDYLTVDAPRHRLYVAHATEIVVVDTAADAVVTRIPDTPGVHGFAVAAALHRGFSSNGRENKVGVVDLASLRPRAKIGTGANPDAILFEPTQGEIYAFNGRGQSATVIDAAHGRVVTTIPLPGKPEFAQTDPDAKRVYVNIEDKNELAVIDPAMHRVVATWPIAPGEEASGLAIDLVHHRLILGCGNARMVVLDSTDGHVVAALPAGAGIDAAAFDPGTQLAFTSNGRDGTVTVVHEDTPDTFTLVQTLTTERSARTMAVDPESHRLYLVSARFLPAESGQRPQIVPGSARLLVYGLRH